MSAPAFVGPLAIPQPIAPRRPARSRPSRPRRSATGRRPVTPQVPTVTVTISVGAGDPASRDRVIAALGDLMAAAGSGLTTVVDDTPVHAVPSLPAAVQVNPVARTVTLNGRPVELSRREFDLLTFLIGHPRRVFSRTHLLEQVWGDLRPGARTVDVHVSRLRYKLDARHDVIATVRGLGYRLAADAPVAMIGY